MAAAAASYTAWLTATAAQAEETAAQAKAAAAAYQTAFTSTVPPPMVAANRSQLTTLVATNVFGRNTQAIAANEAQYGRDVGPGRRGDVRLRSFVSIRDNADTVHPTPTEHQPRRVRPAKQPRSAKPPAPPPAMSQSTVRRFSKHSHRYPMR